MFIHDATQVWLIGLLNGVVNSITRVSCLMSNFLLICSNRKQEIRSVTGCKCQEGKYSDFITVLQKQQLLKCGLNIIF